MSCREYRGRIIEHARSGAHLPAHVADCPECARFLDQQLALTEALREVAADECQAPAALQFRLLAEWNRRRKRRALLWLPAAGALAAGLLVAGVALRPRPPVPPPLAASAVPPLRIETAAPAPPRPRAVRGRRARAPQPQPQPFLAIPYTEPLAPYERAAVIRVDVPVAAVIAAGFRVPTPDPGATVKADLVVGADGRARAIRLITFSNFNPIRRVNP